MTQLTGAGAHLVITVHGIRTFGQWQERLEQEIQRRDPTTTVFHYKYGYFSILAFIFPPTRWLITRDFRKELRKVAKERPWSRIDIVCHSFGTHLVGWGLIGMESWDRPPLHTVILAGSVLKPGFPWKDLVGNAVTRVVNECGIQDGILLLNQLVVLFTGMAGREGFNGMTGESFRNRFFTFGHSGYFEKDGKPDSEFMVERWIPLLLGDAPIEVFPDPRSPSPWRGLTTFLFNNSEPIKLLLWVSPLVALVMFVNAQRTEAIAQRDLANMRLADALIAQGRAEANAENTSVAEQRYVGARQMLRTLGRNPFPAELSLWSLYRRNPPPLMRMQGPRNLLRIALSADGKRAVAISSDVAWLLDLQTGATLNALDKCGLSAILPRRDFELENLAAAITLVGDSIFWGGRDGKLNACASREGTPLWAAVGHHKRITALAASADGSDLVTGAEDGSIVIWDLPRRAPLRSVQAHRGLVAALAISQEGREILSTGTEGSAKLWERDTGRLLAEFTDKRWTGAAVAFIPAWNNYLSVGRRGLGFWSQRSGATPVGIIESDEIVALGGRFVLSPNGQYLLSALRDPFVMVAATDERNYGLLRIWRLPHYKLSRQEVRVSASPGRAFRDYAVRAGDAAFSASGNVVVTAQRDGNIEVWNLEETRERRDHLKFGAVGGRPSFSPDDRLVLSPAQLWEDREGTETGPRRTGAGIWDVATGTRLKLFDDGADVTSVAYSANGRTVLLGDKAGSLRHLDAGSGKSLSVLKAHTGAVTSIDVSPDGGLALTSGDDGEVRIWDLRRSVLARSLENPGDPVQSAIFSPDGHKVAASATKSGIRVWDLEGKAMLAHLPDQQPYSNLVFSPDSKRLAWGSSGRQLAWVDIRTPGQVFTLDAPGASNGGIGFLSDGSWLVSVGADRSLVLWDLDKRRMEYDFKEHHEGTLPLTVAHNRMQVLSNGAYGQHLFWDFLRTHQYLDSEAARIQAVATAARDPANPSALRSIAISYAFAGRCDWAIDLFDRALTTDSNIDASEDLARCYFLAGQRDKALRQFESLKARKAVPDAYADLWIGVLSEH